MTRLFGTQGFRGLVNETLTSPVAHDIGTALANYLGPRKAVAVGWDTRISSQMLGLAISAGLMSGGCNIHLLGLVPTPMLSYAIPQLKLDGGVMVTASHNPPAFNGFKLWDSEGAAFTSEMEQELEKHYLSSRIQRVPWSNCGNFANVEDFQTTYIKNLVAQIDGDLISKYHFHIIADCGGGAASVIIPTLFQMIETKSEFLYCQPDGLFKNRLPEPKETNLKQLIQHVSKAKADIGMAWDGDADRLICITEAGRYLTGDRVFALAAYHWLHKLGEKPKRIVTQVATSDVIRDVALTIGAEIDEVRVGEPNIVKKMKQTNAQVGGEENGGVIYRGWSWTREGMLSALLLLELMASEDSTLEELDKKFPHYFQVKESISTPDELKTPLLSRITGLLPADAECETLDGIKLRYSDGWVLLRPSGTEPIFRVFSEAKTLKQAKKLAKKGLNLAQDALQELTKDTEKKEG